MKRRDLKFMYEDGTLKLFISQGTPWLPPHHTAGKKRGREGGGERERR
jgi:hypothetical protein